MATRRWVGNGQDIAQLNTITPAAVDIGDSFTITINVKSITFVATAATVANVTAGLVSLLNASLLGEFGEITWADATTAITATAKTAGTPFTQTSSSTGGTLTTVVTTANSSKNDVNNANNWSGATVPVSTDDVVFDHSDIDALYNLGALSAVTLASLTIDSTYTGRIGLPEINAESTAPYVEYRAQFFAVGATTINIGQGSGPGSGRIKLDQGAVQTALSIYQTAGGVDSSEIPAIQWKGTHVSNTVSVYRGEFGAAVYLNETAVIATLRVGYVESQDGDATVRCSSGVTLTTVSILGGEVELNSGATTITKIGGDLTLNAGNVTTLTNDLGVVRYRGTGTITTCTIGNGGVLDVEDDMRGRTITTLNLHAGAVVRDHFGTIALTNPFTTVRCSLLDVVADFGQNRSHSVV